MSGHMVTPYELTARRKRARGAQKNSHLLLASVSDEETIDLLDLVDTSILEIEPLRRDDEWVLQCVGKQRQQDSLSLVFAVDVSGERESIRDRTKPGRPRVFDKGKDHIARFYATALLYRPPDGTEGRLLLHSPWGRGGTRTQVTKLLQNAANQEPKAKAQLETSAIVPRQIIERFLRNAKNTRITYTKPKGITSEFEGRSHGTRAEMGLVVKGTDTIPYRDALQAALRSPRNRDGLYTVRMRDDSSDDAGVYREERFDDVIIDLQTGTGLKRYSLRDQTIPTASFDLTSEINLIYYALPDDDDTDWANLLLQGVTPLLEHGLQDYLPNT